MPLLANLRCGLWYVQPTDDEDSNHIMASSGEGQQQQQQQSEEEAAATPSCHINSSERSPQQQPSNSLLPTAETPPTFFLKCTDGTQQQRTADGPPTCYFKSTDGHCNNWMFSLTRLNMHVAMLAARKGGVMIVDATRKGKVSGVREQVRENGG